MLSMLSDFTFVQDLTQNDAVTKFKILSGRPYENFLVYKPNYIVFFFKAFCEFRLIFRPLLCKYKHVLKFYKFSKSSVQTLQNGRFHV